MSGEEVEDSGFQSQGLSELGKKIKKAFDVFDHEGNETIDVRELGSVVRSLGKFPTEEELLRLIADCEEEESSGTIKFSFFRPNMEDIFKNKKFEQASAKVLKAAFEAIDEEKKGSFTSEEMTKIMTEHGEPFSTEELDEMLSAAVNVEKGVVLPEQYINILQYNAD
eukprot:Nk52_evm7s236 gene=Nk52_evmTU7s236